MDDSRELVPEVDIRLLELLDTHASVPVAQGLRLRESIRRPIWLLFVSRVLRARRCILAAAFVLLHFGQGLSNKLVSPTSVWPERPFPDLVDDTLQLPQGRRLCVRGIQQFRANSSRRRHMVAQDAPKVAPDSPLGAPTEKCPLAGVSADVPALNATWGKKRPQPAVGLVTWQRPGAPLPLAPRRGKQGCSSTRAQPLSLQQP